MLKSLSRSIRTSLASASCSRFCVAYHPGWLLSVHKRFRVPWSFSIAIHAVAFDSTARSAPKYRFCTVFSRCANLSGDSRSSQNAISFHSKASHTVSADLSPVLPKPAGSAVITYLWPGFGDSNSWHPYGPNDGSWSATSSSGFRISAGMTGFVLPSQPSYASDGYLQENRRVSPTNSVFNPRRLNARLCAFIPG